MAKEPEKKIPSTAAKAIKFAQKPIQRAVSTALKR
jgi:hypothetical protein